MTQELTATSIVSLFETDKAQRQSFVSSVISELKEGNKNPLDMHLQLKCMEDIIKQVTGNEEYKQMVLTEAQKHGKSFGYKLAKVEIKEAGTSYNYAVCEDVVYDDLCAQMTELKAKMKEREKFLQNVPGEGIADPVNGNMIYRAAKSSTTTTAITLL